jgi:selenocysteine lyase/cysteine desulfurase
MEAKTDPACLVEHFETFRKNITGIDAEIPTPYGKKPLIYLDWTASGRLYAPIEKKLSAELGPYLANTHTDTSFTGQFMTDAYHSAIEKIKAHVNADKDYVLLQAGFGMTGAVNKLQRILGLRVHENHKQSVLNSLDKRPVVFVSRLEHHSNHISWLETIAETVLIPFDENGYPDANAFEDLLKQYKDRPLYLSLSACSNVTGIEPDLKTFIRLIHRFGGYAFTDYACSAPYVDMDLGANREETADAIMFSPHKFLGGPGTGGILIMRKELYKNRIPDEPGGGTVVWTDPWDGAVYLDDIEARETGGTPGFLSMIKTALATGLKEKMDTEKIRRREHQLLEKLFNGLETIKGIKILEGDKRDRLGVVSFLTEDLPYYAVVRLLNDLFGIQTRGGCSCAGTYGHYLLDLDRKKSRELKERILHQRYECKPGWTRVSIHPTTTDNEVEKVLEAMEFIMKQGKRFLEKDYMLRNGQYYHKNFDYKRFAANLDLD